MRLELTRPNGHYPLKVARLPIPPLLHNICKTNYCVPRTGLEPARLSTLAPETSASTIPPPGQLPLSGKRGSNSRPQPWQGCALPTELFPRFYETWHFRLRSLRESKLSHSLARKVRVVSICFLEFLVNCEGDETRTHTTQRSLPPQSSASTNSATPP